MSILMFTLRHMKNSPYCITDSIQRASSTIEKPISSRMKEFKEKLRETAPFEKLEEIDKHPDQQDAYTPFPENTNPVTGEIGGPTGPEPTRYGDWERKGRCTDF